MIGKLMQQHQTHPTEPKRQISRYGRTRYREGPCEVRSINTCRKRQRKVTKQARVNLLPELELLLQQALGVPLRMTPALDFRVQGLLHSTVEQAEYSRVRELIDRIEDHPHRDE